MCRPLKPPAPYVTLYSPESGVLRRDIYESSGPAPCRILRGSQCFTAERHAMSPLRRILVAIKDLSAKQQPALMHALQLAKGSGAKLELFHALSKPIYFSILGSDPTFLDTKRDVHADALRRLERIAAPLR